MRRWRLTQGDGALIHRCNLFTMAVVASVAPRELVLVSGRTNCQHYPSRCHGMHVGISFRMSISSSLFEQYYMHRRGIIRNELTSLAIVGARGLDRRNCLRPIYLNSRQHWLRQPGAQPGNY